MLYKLYLLANFTKEETAAVQIYFARYVSERNPSLISQSLAEQITTEAKKHLEMETHEAYTQAEQLLYEVFEEDMQTVLENIMQGFTNDPNSPYQDMHYRKADKLQDEDKKASSEDSRTLFHGVEEKI